MPCRSFLPSLPALLSLAVGVALMAHLPHGRYAAMSATASIISLPTAPTLTPSLVLDLSTEAGADVTMLLAANDILYLVEKTSGEVRAFPLHGMDRAEQFSKVLRRLEGDNGLIIGQPISFTMAGSLLYVLDDRATLWQYDAAPSVRTLVGLRVESRQGTLKGIAFPDGPAELDILDASAQGVQGQLWAYTRGPRGYTTSPRLLPWGNGMPRGSMTLVSGMGKGELLVTVGGMPFLVWPGGHRPAAKVAMPGSGQLNAVGTVWRHTGVPTTILLLNGPKREIDALRVGNRAALPALHFTAPAGYRGPWRAITGDAQSRRVYLLDGANHVFALPMPSSWVNG